jgi:hypothetical protein
MVSLRAQAAPKGYLARLVDRYLDGFEARLDRLLGSSLTPTISIRSTPQGATFEADVPGTGAKLIKTTDDEIHNLWRSVYQATVSKVGYRPAAYTLDLMNDPRTTVVCTLVRNNVNGTSNCRAQ